MKKKEQKIKVLITAGPTREAIDPVRYISNHSSGKMGIAIADSFANSGCEVYLVLGPSQIHPQSKSVHVISVVSAQQMFDACEALHHQVDVAVFAAAVADYTPKTVSTQKVKKHESNWNIELTKTKDIALELGRKKTLKQVHVVFALETENELGNALQKLEKKNADFVVLNSARDKGAAFGADTNKATLVFSAQKLIESGLKTKAELAKEIRDEALKCLTQKRTS